MTYIVKVNNLVSPLEYALREIGYTSENIELKGAKSYHLRQEAPDGAQGFVCAVCLKTGTYKLGLGCLSDDSYFYDNSIDYDTSHISMNGDIAIIKGIKNQNKMVAYVLLHEDLFNVLPGNKDSKTKKQK